MNELEVIALVEAIPAKNLRRGQVGTIVERLAPGMVEVEFADLDGKIYALCAVPENNLLVLHHTQTTRLQG